MHSYLHFKNENYNDHNYQNIKAWISLNSNINRKLKLTYINSVKSKKQPSEIVWSNLPENFEITLSGFKSFKLFFSLFFCFKRHINHLFHSIFLWEISLSINIVHHPFFWIIKNLICKLQLHKLIGCVFLILVWVIFSRKISISPFEFSLIYLLKMLRCHIHYFI